MNTAPFFWLIAAVGFLVLEGCTFNMTSIWFAIGAAAALISCLFTDLFRVQALLFIVVSVLCLLAFRPLFLPALPQWLSEGFVPLYLAGTVVVVIYDIGLSRLIGLFYHRLGPGGRA